ncbi:hypothetical protein BDFB_012402 [Asbolus verrucosus]|uniref:Uncharacterized protein n=1 Tax=Asbolus verrucosus TaxID=1661398 RepID=A0A482VG60_ASBVE|nr:hypothetical protein BDFB_012402 [Asbolus verrucosus]
MAIYQLRKETGQLLVGNGVEALGVILYIIAKPRVLI